MNFIDLKEKFEDWRKYLFKESELSERTIEEYIRVVQNYLIHISYNSENFNIPKLIAFIRTEKSIKVAALKNFMYFAEIDLPNYKKKEFKQFKNKYVDEFLENTNYGQRTKKRYRNDLKGFFEKTNIKLENITKEEIEYYIESGINFNIKRNRYTAFNAFLKYYNKSGLLDKELLPKRQKKTKKL